MRHLPRFFPAFLAMMLSGCGPGSFMSDPPPRRAWVDINGDGVITQKEREQYSSSHHPYPAMPDQRKQRGVSIVEADENHDNLVSAEELRRAWAKHDASTPPKHKIVSQGNPFHRPLRTPPPGW